MKRVTVTVRAIALAGALLVSTLSGSAVAEADPGPTTVSCLGDLQTVMTCPAGTKLHKSTLASTCRTIKPDKARKASVRQGPSIWFWQARTDGKKVAYGGVSRAGHYDQHKKTGRHYYFSRDGALERINDFASDRSHGQDVKCHANGAVKSVMPYKLGELDGLVRRWADDGSLKSATRYRNGKSLGRVKPSAAESQAPRDLCRPRTCSLTP